MFNPKAVVQPASRYAQAVGAPFTGRRLIVSGQVGVMPDGVVLDGYTAQAEQAWANILSLLEAADMGVADLVSIRVYDVAPGNVAVYRAVRDKVLNGHLVAATYVIVAGLALPQFLTEIEAEAVKG